jgi:glycine/D-amino acid oxidase-like deaminating enzyme
VLLVAAGARVESQRLESEKVSADPAMLCVAGRDPLAIGQASAHKGLWMHFGHGHQGFTLGPTTGRMLVELMLGEKPFVDARPFSPARWC